MSDIPEDNAMMAPVQISSAKSAAINQVLHRRDHVLKDNVLPYWMPIPRAADRVPSVLSSISPMLNDENLYDHIRNNMNLGKFKLSIGFTNSSYK